VRDLRLAGSIVADLQLYSHSDCFGGIWRGGKQAALKKNEKGARRRKPRRLRGLLMILVLGRTRVCNLDLKARIGAPLA
jgi:hypothetical protein